MKRAALVLSLLSLGAFAVAQTSPKQQFGHNIGDDYFLANYLQLSDYWKKLDQESPRFKLVEIGKTEEGRPQYMAVISDPANMANLGRYREIAAKMARGEISGADANRLAGEGKSVVWIDGGLHASEVLCAQVLMELGWQLVSRKDDETQNILKNCIVLLVHANPDGMALCTNWYMRNPKTEDRSLSGLPVLYQKYIGHDNNRDFFTSTQSETKNMNRVMYRQWYPQIVYNQHQTGPAGTVMFAPPFRDPFAYEVDPLVRSGLDMVSSAMENRFISENKPGVTVRSGAPYSGWWNGGLRTMAYFHNMVGILTETIGSPTPMKIPFVASKQLPTMDLLSPIEPQEWHFRQSVDYSITSCYAILDYASRYRRDLLMNIYRMGRNNIARGRKDSWTPDPRRIAAAKSMDDLRKPEDRAPYAYVVPSTQEDFSTATKFVNALIETGIEVRRADKPFDYDGQTWPAGSYVVRCDQAFRPHVISMFEPQDHPDDIPYPGAAPTPPYDSAGWTLAYTMGVQFHRGMTPMKASLPLLTDDAQPNIPSAISANAKGYIIDPAVNDAFTAANRLRKAGAGVNRITGGGPDRGAFYVTGSAAAYRILSEMAKTHGVRAKDADAAPDEMAPLVTPRIALLDRYGGSMPSGWIRWILEKFEFGFTVVYPPDIDNGALSSYDVLVMPSDMAIGGFRGRGGQFGGPTEDDKTIPEMYRKRIGSLSTETSLGKLKEFVDNGGTIVAIGRATSIGEQLGLPVANGLVGNDGQPLPRSKFFVPGSVLEVHVNNDDPLAFGMSEKTDFFFDNSPVFKLTGPGDKIAWFDTDKPLRSGWAWGQEALKDTVAAASFELGKGRVVLYGPEITFRSQPHATYKLLFNALAVGR